MADTVLRAKSTPKECRRLARSVVSFLEQATEDQELLYDLELLITEACSNVIIHGYKRNDEGDIEMRLSLRQDKRIVLEISDWGEPYTGPDKDDFSPDPSSESGRGQYIISKLADAYSYGHSAGRNTLRIEKDLKQP